MQKAYQNQCPPHSTISKWYFFLKRGGESSVDAKSSRRSSNPANPPVLKQISDELDKNSKLSLSVLIAKLRESKHLDRISRKAPVTNARTFNTTYKNNWRF